MKERLPNQLLDLKRPKGKQSADWHFRLVKSQSDIMNDLQSIKSNLISLEHLNNLWSNLSQDTWAMNFSFRPIIINKFKGGES